MKICVFKSWPFVSAFSSIISKMGNLSHLFCIGAEHMGRKCNNLLWFVSISDEG